MQTTYPHRTIDNAFVSRTASSTPAIALVPFIAFGIIKIGLAGVALPAAWRLTGHNEVDEP